MTGEQTCYRTPQGRDQQIHTVRSCRANNPVYKERSRVGKARRAAKSRDLRWLRNQLCDPCLDPDSKKQSLKATFSPIREIWLLTGESVRLWNYSWRGQGVRWWLSILWECFKREILVFLKKVHREQSQMIWFDIWNLLQNTTERAGVGWELRGKKNGQELIIIEAGWGVHNGWLSLLLNIFGIFHNKEKCEVCENKNIVKKTFITENYL